jgi:hypothetical protein
VALFKPICFGGLISLLPKRLALPASSQRHNKSLNTGLAISGRSLFNAGCSQPVKQTLEFTNMDLDKIVFRYIATPVVLAAISFVIAIAASNFIVHLELLAFSPFEMIKAGESQEWVKTVSYSREIVIYLGVFFSWALPAALALVFLANREAIRIAFITSVLLASSLYIVGFLSVFSVVIASWLHGILIVIGFVVLVASFIKPAKTLTKCLQRKSQSGTV